MADGRDLPPWFVHLEDEDQQFIKRFILASGSLKELARGYGVSYPTIRLRLDRLIARVSAYDGAQIDDPFQARIRLLVSQGDLSTTIAKDLLRLHEQAGRAGKSGG